MRLKDKLHHALKGDQVPTPKDFLRFSRNYRVSKTFSMPGLDPLAAKMEGNLLFDSNSYVPKESMLKTTLQLYGFGPVDIFEVTPSCFLLLLLSFCVCVCARAYCSNWVHLYVLTIIYLLTYFIYAVYLFV